VAVEPREASGNAVGAAAKSKTIPCLDVLRLDGRSPPPLCCIFFLTFDQNNLIYESHCDLLRLQILMSRENGSMKNATKKAAKKKAAPKKKGK
jgi:hypothetical protein